MLNLGLGILIGGLFGLSARWNWWRLPKAGIPILMYHKIGDAPAGSKLKKLWVSVDRLTAHMALIKKRGFVPITFRDLYAAWDQKTPLPSKPILITFDDGYKNNIDNGYPVLKHFGFPATVFVVVNTIEGDNRWHDPQSEVRIPMMSWAELKILNEAGWEIGSHTLNHRRLALLSSTEVDEELRKSRFILSEKLGRPIETLAYPYGNGEDVPSIRDAAQKAGYRLAVGVHAGKWGIKEIQASPFNLPRVFVRGDETMFDFSLQLSCGKSRF